MVPATFAPGRAADESGIETGLGRAAFEAVLRFDLLFWLGLRLAPDFMLRGPLATDPSLLETASADERARIAAVLRTILPVSERAEGIAFDSLTAGRPEPVPLGEVGCPLLAVSAEDDLYGTAAAARHAAEGVPDGRAVVFPTGGHLLAGRMGEAWDLVTAFLRSPG
jgi:pimeloyl-ACP methyl ester carboxylesterase